MTAAHPLTLPRIDEPTWPDSHGLPLVFLLDASSTLERRLLRSWVDRHRPGFLEAGDLYITSIPRSRRHRAGDWRVNPRLRSRLEHDGDQMAVPLRVVWLPGERGGERRARWSDVLKLGDPRDPDWLRQAWNLRRYPERCRIIAGEPAPISELRERWQPADLDHDGMDFTEFVSLQASLALERAERRIRGNRYKVPAFVPEDLLSRREVVPDIEALARASGLSSDEVAKRARRYLKEMAATHSPFVIDLVAQAIRHLIRRAYGEHIEFDREELRRVFEIGQRHALVFLPSHKSNLDHLVLQLALYENGYPPNHTAGGINMNFWPVGLLVRRSGVFFIRRTFAGNAIYKFVLKQYLRYLVEKRFTLEWYLEGGRSRSGKLRAPRFGMPGYVVEAFHYGGCEDVCFIPVSIAYDQIQDVGSYAHELSGGSKRSESIGYVVDAVRSLMRPHGKIYLRFGEPVSLAATVGTDPIPPAERYIAVQKLAFEVSARINQVTPITPISLVTLALLGARDRALTVDQVLAQLEHFLNYVKLRSLPTTEELRLDTPERVRSALDALADHGVVTRYDAGPETVYAVARDQHLAASYYRNTIIHFFVDGAIAELALVSATEAGDDEAQDVFWDETMRIRDLLKFEFFFRRKKEYRRQLEHQLALQDPLWQDQLASGEAAAVLRGLRPFTSHSVLRPFLEAYRVVAEHLAIADVDEEIDEKPFLADCLARAKQYHLQRRIQTADSVSLELLRSAWLLAVNRGIHQPGEGVAEGRASFAAEIEDLIRRIDTVEALVAGRWAGIID